MNILKLLDFNFFVLKHFIMEYRTSKVVREELKVDAEKKDFPSRFQKHFSVSKYRFMLGVPQRGSKRFDRTNIKSLK